MGHVDESELLKKERLFGGGLLLFIALCTVVDVIEDLTEGSSLAHVFGESFLILVCVGAGVYLWRRVAQTWRATNASINTQLTQASADAQRWREAHLNLSKGMFDAISRQLESWGLSAAEKEITFLLMKGLSFKEIADLRKTSEHTVRQQAATVYRKSGLDGRSHLTAFFLEDVLNGSSS